MTGNISDARTRVGKSGVAPGESTLSVDRVAETFLAVASLNTTRYDTITAFNLTVDQAVRCFTRIKMKLSKKRK